MRNKSRYRRTADQRRRRWGATATGVGIAAGGAVAAAFVSMGTASADDPLAPATDDVAFADLAQAIDPSALTAAGAPNDFIVGGAVAAAALPAQADAFEELVQTLDTNAFTSTGAPNDFIGTLASNIDSNLATTAFGTELDTIATQILAATADNDGDFFSDLVEVFDPSAFDSEGVPVDFIGTAANQLDMLLAPSVFGPELDLGDQIIALLTGAVF